jgi:hypothetical protein
MANRLLALFGKLIYSGYWCVGFVVGMGPIVMPVSYGIIVGGMAGLAMVTGMVLLERLDEHNVDDHEEAGRQRSPAHFRNPVRRGSSTSRDIAGYSTGPVRQLGRRTTAAPPWKRFRGRLVGW